MLEGAALSEDSEPWLQAHAAFVTLIGGEGSKDCKDTLQRSKFLLLHFLILNKVAPLRGSPQAQGQLALS